MPFRVALFGVGQAPGLRRALSPPVQSTHDAGGNFQSWWGSPAAVFSDVAHATWPRRFRSIHRAPAFAIVIALLLTACSKPKEAEVEPVALVQVTPVVDEPIQRVITADGTLRALDQSAITPKISAPVARFLVNRGDHVRKGQLLAVLENRDLVAAVADAKGAHDQASAAYRNVASATVPDEVVKAQQDVDAARQQLDAAQKLVQSREQLFREGALARRLVDEASVAFAQAKSQYETAQRHLQSVQNVGRHEEVKTVEGAMESAKAKYEAAQAQLAYSEIHSPIAGVVADRPAFPGEMATAGTALITVMDVSTVIARVNIPQAQAAHVRVGQPAVISATDSSAQSQGKVTVVSPAIDPNSTTVEVWVQAPNPGERLRPGGSVHVTITGETVADALVVPATALLPAADGGTAVFVVTADSIAHEHKVEVGIRGPDKVQLTSGANAGDPVVISGGVGLQDGAKVKIAKPGAEK